MADATVVNALRRFFNQEEIEAAYKAAFEALQERLTEVVVTSAGFEGGSSNGQIVGDPRDLMDACELLLQEFEDEEDGVDPSALPGTSHVDFSKRYIGT